MKQLRPYQQNAVNALWDFWRSEPSGTPLIVCPTGSGKSLIGAEICRVIHEKKPEYRGYIITHSKEIVSQNSKAVSAQLNNFPVGIYSAGLGLKQFRKITLGNIQSIYKKDFPAVEYCIFDECHRISSVSVSMYGKFIDKLKSKNPNVKIVGLTATPFRMDRGHLVGDLFSDIAFDISMPELIVDGFLSPVISLPSKNNVDLSNVKTSGYDYNQSDLQEAFDVKELVEEHVAEIIAAASERGHWLIFSSGVKHAKDITEELQRRGIESDFVTGEMLPIERDRKLNRFRTGETRALVNCDILTTGFDYPDIDLIALVRATRSTGLYIQIVGRGMRIANGKRDALLLDFGGNIERHGPIDCISVSQKTKGDKAEITKAPTKECPKCGAVIAIRYSACPNCGADLPKYVQDVTVKPSSAPVLSTSEIWDVTDWRIKIHVKNDIKMLRMTLNQASEFFCFDHGGFAADMAKRKWLKYSGLLPAPVNTTEAFARREELKIPAQIEVRPKGKFYEILKIIGKLSTGLDTYKVSRGDLADHI